MEIQTYEWNGPDGLTVQRSLTEAMWIQVGAGLVFLSERQVRALGTGVRGLVKRLDEIRAGQGLPRMLCWNCGETDPEYVSDETCSRCGAQHS